MPHLILRADDHGYKLFHFLSDITIGRDPNRDIALDPDPDNTISRRHASIRQDQDGFLLLDSSLNGTRVNDELIETHRLCDGDRFQIADYTFTFIQDVAVKPIFDYKDAPVDKIDLKEILK